jgi:maltose O-acetyltransferase
MTAKNVDSWLWHVRVNRLAASHRVSPARRARLLRAAGLDAHPGANVHPGCFFFGAEVALADGSWIAHRCYFDSRARIEVGEQAFLGYEVMLCTSGHDVGGPQRRAGDYRADPIVIGDGAWVGARALVLGGVTVGAGSIVAAGAVVTADTEPHGLYAGVPARRVRDLPV